MNTELHVMFSDEIASAKVVDADWTAHFEDSRLLTGDFDKDAVERLAAEAPSAFLAGWVASFLPAMLMQQR